MNLSRISLNNLVGVHPDLVKLAKAVIGVTAIDFRIVDGLRTMAEEKINKAKGASQTLNSMHLKRKDGWGHAVDFVVLTNGQPDWFHIPAFQKIGAVFKKQAQTIGVPIVWGGDWKTLKDFGHIELDRNVYPG